MRWKRIIMPAQIEFYHLERAHDTGFVLWFAIHNCVCPFSDPPALGCAGFATLRCSLRAWLAKLQLHHGSSKTGQNKSCTTSTSSRSGKWCYAAVHKRNKCIKWNIFFHLCRWIGKIKQTKARICKAVHFNRWDYSACNLHMRYSRLEMDFLLLSKVFNTSLLMNVCVM